MFNIHDFYEAKNLEEALSLLAEKPSLKVIAGGTDILIRMHGGYLDKVELLSLKSVKELYEIKLLEDATISIGALCTFTQISKNKLIQEKLDFFGKACLTMGGPQIRNMATLGGNICNGATSADSASSLFALNAKLKIKSMTAERVVPIQEFYLGPGKVNLKPGEIVQEILIAKNDYENYVGHYIKFSMRKAMDIATLGVAVVCKLNGNKIEDLRIGLGVAGPTPLRCQEAEQYVKGKICSPELLETIGRLAVNDTKARTSWRASKEYREHLVQTLCVRALKTILNI